MSAEVVYCLPHAGGGRHQFLSWTTRFGGDFDWVPLEYPGHFTRDEQPAYPTFGHAVAELAAEIQADAAGRRIGLFGHSLGGSLAYEIGSLLTRRDGVTLDAVVVSSAEPPSALTVTRQRYFELDDDALLAHLIEPGNDSPLARMIITELLPMIRSDYRLHHSYRPEVDSAIDVPLHICSGTDERIAENLGAWQDHATGPVSFHRFDGGHLYWQSDATHLITTLRAAFAPAARRIAH